jgi:hypothetical protein
MLLVCDFVPGRAPPRAACGSGMSPIIVTTGRSGAAAVACPSGTLYNPAYETMNVDVEVTDLAAESRNAKVSALPAPTAIRRA